MFKRDPTAGSLYWLGLRDASGATLDGGKTYKLTVPQPVPDKLFWSVTVYDTRIREAEVHHRPGQGGAALDVRAEEQDRQPRPSIFTSDQPLPPDTRTSGSRPFPARDGSSTSASTALSRQPSMEAGSFGGLRRGEVGQTYFAAAAWTAVFLPMLSRLAMMRKEPGTPSGISRKKA